mmetsp:Transcript_22617/g.62774  ORF Transcript_22617/g.62774 Transcript_22617/m.62774 type:complete len:446 (-) Transcript_22617:265-1602(-)
MGKNKGKKNRGGTQALADAMAQEHGAVPEVEVDAAQEVEMLLAVPEGEEGRPYSCRKLLEARYLQRAWLTYLLVDRDVEKESLEQQTMCLCRFLKSYVSALSAAEWTAHSMGDDIMIDAGFVAPFVRPGTQGPEFGVPAVIYEDTVCDNVDELARAACAAIFACLVYQNVPQEDPESAPDQVAAVFLALALNSVKTPEQQAAMDEQLKQLDLEVEGVPRLTCSELVWLLLQFRADLNSLTAKVYHAIGKEKEMKVSMVKALKDYSDMAKICPENPVGYLKFGEVAMNLNQIKHAGTVIRQGLAQCDKVGAKLHSMRMAYMMAVCRVMGCGSGTSSDEVQSEAAEADDTMWTMGEIEELQARARADLADTLAWLPMHLRTGTTGVDQLQSRHQAILNDTLLEAAHKRFGEIIEPGMRMPAINAVISTPLPTELPKGALVQQRPQEA